MPNRLLRDSIRTSPTLAALSFAAECLFYRLLTACDDFGCFEADPRVVKGACMPTRDVTIHEVGTWLGELAASGLIHQYEVDDRCYLQFVRFEKHNRRRSTNPKYPLPFDSKCLQMSADASKCEQVIASTSVSSGNPLPADVVPARARARSETETYSYTETDTLAEQHPSFEIADHHRALYLDYRGSESPSVISNDQQWTLTREQWASFYRAVAEGSSGSPCTYEEQKQGLAWAYKCTAVWGVGMSWARVLSGRRPAQAWAKHVQTILDQMDSAKHAKSREVESDKRPESVDPIMVRNMKQIAQNREERIKAWGK